MSKPKEIPCVLIEAEKLEALKSKCAIYEAALKFYGNEESYLDFYGADDEVSIHRDSGYIARRALQDASKIGKL